jgi:Tfp pilus assembly protein PilV
LWRAGGVNNPSTAAAGLNEEAKYAVNEVNMMAAPNPEPRAARWRSRIVARLRAQEGDTMIEVVVAALLVALIAAAVLNGYAGVARLSGAQRLRAEAGSLAQQDQERLRGLTISQLTTTGSSGVGNQSATDVVNGTTYTVTSTARYVSGSTGTAACTNGQATGTADEIAITSTVTWGTDNNGRAPVIIHGVVTPSVGGALIASASTLQGTTGLTGPLAGVGVAVAGPSVPPALITDTTGCAVFGSLAGGTYTVTFTPPTNYVDLNGNTTLPTQSPTVTNTQTAGATVGPLALAGSAQACFVSNWTTSTVFTPSSTCPYVASGGWTPGTADTWILAGGGMTAASRVFGTDSTPTNNTYTTLVATPQTLFPTTTTNYVAYAGGCSAGDFPTAAGQESIGVTSGATTSVVLPEPAMIVKVYSGTNTSSALITGNPLVTVTDVGCANNKDYPPSQIPTSTQGALVTPGMPYETSYTVCASYNGEYNTATGPNTVYGSPGNPFNIFLGSGASGRHSGSCP